MKNAFFFLLLIWSGLVMAQQKSMLVSGPMIGQTDHRTAKIWLEPLTEIKSLAIQYWKKGEKNTAKYKMVNVEDGNGAWTTEFHPVQTEIGGLEPGTSYDFCIWVNGKETEHRGEFNTRELWQWRKPVPDFSFLTGSCTYFNEPAFDRPGKSYGMDSSIFSTMANDKAAFMLWLGDNWYTREVDYATEWGLWYRASRERSRPILQPFLKAMPHYAIWDDHDYGPNDMGKSYHLKTTSREVFKSYWANPSYGNGREGIYTKLSYSDVDFFLLDDRTWRTEDNMPSTVNGQPNPEKRMLGAEQLDWLKNALVSSQASFKFIVVGSQVLNPASPFDKLLDFPFEYNELTGFIEEQKISGIVFLTGDRHHSEIIQVKRINNYPLYDITVSPLTSGTHVFGEAEKNNPYRVYGLDQKQNYGKISISGTSGNRKLEVKFIGVKGEDLGSWSVTQQELKAN
jgi:alkaline phosphatase D